VTPRARLGDVKNTNGPAFVRNRVAWWSSTVQQQQDGWGCAGGVSLAAGVRDQWRSYGRENAGAAKLAMNVLIEGELIFCVQQIADY
jgi:hypothetical protein